MLIRFLAYLRTAIKTLYIDLDHTVLNTDKLFYVTVRTYAIEQGISDNQFLQIYKKLGMDGTDDILSFLQSLEVPRRDARAFAYKLARTLTGNISGYVFPDVMPFLLHARARGIKTCILSRGPYQFQERKIVSSGLLPYADDVRIISGRETKSSAIEAQQRGGADIAFIDNNPSELNEVQQAFPQATVIAVNRVPDEAIQTSSTEKERAWCEARMHALNLDGNFLVIRSFFELMEE